MYTVTLDKAESCLAIARQCIQVAQYDWYHENSKPPEIVNCYTFVQWVFSCYGISLPQNLLGQIKAGYPVQHPYKPADIIFTKGPWHGIGHNGILTNSNTIIHASRKEGTVIEEDWEVFLQNRTLKCVVRVF